MWVSCSSGTSTQGASGGWFSEAATTTALLGRTQPLVDAVQFEAGRAAPRKAFATDRVGRDTVEDPAHPGIAARLGFDAVVRADEVALRGEADAHQLLRRPRIAPPQAAVFGVELVVVLAGLGRPGADAAFAAADLDQPSRAGSSAIFQ
jgi:hypothetical protein